MMQRTANTVARRARAFSSNVKAAPSASTAAPRQEYPTSFISHLSTQKLNVFNIGIAFVTLSLSSQLVTFKQKNEKLEAENALVHERVQLLEDLVVSLGGTVPTDEAKEAEAAAAELAAQADAERVKKAREEEARELVALTEAAGERTTQKKKRVLI